MTESVRMWTEIVFNIVYLIIIYTLVLRMSRSLRHGLLHSDVPLLKLFRNGILLLAFGDTGHVGFRVLAYALGGLDTVLDIGGFSVPLTGAGALATAYTITFLYMILLDVFRRRFDKKRDAAYTIIMLIGMARLVFMALPGNEWSRSEPPYTWSLIRNGLLTAMGLPIAWKMLREARRNGDHVFSKMAVCIFISFAFYLPVILFVHKIPMLGMLMIPKTIAYIAMAWIGYKGLYPRTR